MKNKEKYAKEIIEEAVESGLLAIDKRVNKVKACYYVDCENCLFYRANKETDTCTGALSKWANSEYKEKKEFSEADKALVRGVDKLNWFARDKNGVVYGYVDKPLKKGSVWDVKAEVGNEYAVERVSIYSSATFEPLSWEDEEPTHRDEILGNKETEKYTEILKVKETRKYTEILRLKEMLEKANIPFTFTDDFFGAKKRGILEENSYPAYQIRLNKNIDVIQHFGSYGEDENLLEIKGGLTVEESKESSVLGYLTAEEVFKRFKYCYENRTTFYKEEQK